MSEFTVIVLIVVLAIVAVSVPWIRDNATTYIVNRNELRSKNGNVSRDRTLHRRNSDVILPLRRDDENGKRSG